MLYFKIYISHVSFFFETGEENLVTRPCRQSHYLKESRPSKLLGHLTNIFANVNENCYQ